MELLERKKLNSRNRKCTVSPSSALKDFIIERPKSKESKWREDNVENQESRIKNVESLGLFFYHVDLGAKKYQEAVKRDFQYYHKLSLNYDKSIGQEQILLEILERYHPALKQMLVSPFYKSKLRKVLSIVMKQELPEDHGGHTIQWQHFLELWILTSPHLRSLAEKNDCNQVIRNFVEAFLEIKEDDYFRDEFVSRLYRCLEGDKEQMEIIEDIIWSWLD